MLLGKLENWQDIRELILMSIGTDKGRWWADKEFGSELWKLRQSGKSHLTRSALLDRWCWNRSGG